MKNAGPKSDWDLLIACEYGKIWTGRTMVTAVLQLLGKRRYGKKIADRACLNFFVTDQSLEVITKDLFSANEYAFIFPLYGEKVFERFQIKNRWIQNMKPNYRLQEIAPLKLLQDSKLTGWVQKMGEFFLAPVWLENVLGKLEKRKIMQNPKTLQEDSLVYADKEALIFLPNPHGPVIFERFKKKIGELGL